MCAVIGIYLLNTECNVVVCVVDSAAVCSDGPWYAETLVELESQ
jgi:hypothetical protein